MLNIGEELNKATNAFQLHARPYVLNLCMAPGGFAQCLLDLNPHAQLDAFSLPRDQGGHQVSIHDRTRDARISVRFTDVTMFAKEMGHTEDLYDRSPWTDLAQKWPYQIGHYDSSVMAKFCVDTSVKSSERVSNRPTSPARSSFWVWKGFDEERHSLDSCTGSTQHEVPGSFMSSNSFLTFSSSS